VEGIPVRFHVAGEQFDVCTLDVEQAYPVGGAPFGEQPQISRVADPRGAGVAGQESGDRHPLGDVGLADADQHSS
jgi:hypothetical protein